MEINLICKVNLIYFESNIRILTFQSHSKYKVTFLKSLRKQLVRNRSSKHNITGGVLQYPFSSVPSSRGIEKEKSLTLFKQTQTIYCKTKWKCKCLLWTYQNYWTDGVGRELWMSPRATIYQGQGHLPLSQVFPNLQAPEFGHFQGWGIPDWASPPSLWKTSAIKPQPSLF